MIFGMKEGIVEEADAIDVGNVTMMTMMVFMIKGTFHEKFFDIFYHKNEWKRYFPMSPTLREMSSNIYRIPNFETEQLSPCQGIFSRKFMYF